MKKQKFGWKAAAVVGGLMLAGNAAAVPFSQTLSEPDFAGAGTNGPGGNNIFTLTFSGLDPIASGNATLRIEVRGDVDAANEDFELAIFNPGIMGFDSAGAFLDNNTGNDFVFIDVTGPVDDIGADATTNADFFAAEATSVTYPNLATLINTHGEITLRIDPSANIDNDLNGIEELFRATLSYDAPVPATLALVGVGVLLVGARRKKRDNIS